MRLSSAFLLVSHFVFTSNPLVLSRLQLHGDGGVLASQTRASPLLFGAGFPDLLHLLFVQRRTLRPPQHHVRQHRENEPVPVSAAGVHVRQRGVHFLRAAAQHRGVSEPVHARGSVLQRRATLLHLSHDGGTVKD